MTSTLSTRRLGLALLILLATSNLGYGQTLFARMVSGVNAQTGVVYTFAPSDATKLVTFANTSPIAATLPSGSTANYGAGHIFAAQNLGPGIVTITCSGCLIFSNGSGSSAFILVAGQGVDLWSGTGGSYSAVTGTSLGITGDGVPNHFTGWISPNTLGTAPCAYNGSDTLCAGLLVTANNGTTAGAIAIAGNANPSTVIPGVGYFGISGFADPAAASYLIVPNATPPTTGQYLVAGASAPCTGSAVTCVPLNPSNLAAIKGTLSAAGTCNSGAEGTIASVTDSNTVTWGATITGGSTNHVLAQCNGSNWTVIGK